MMAPTPSPGSALPTITSDFQVSQDRRRPRPGWRVDIRGFLLASDLRICLPIRLSQFRFTSLPLFPLTGIIVSGEPQAIVAAWIIFWIAIRRVADTIHHHAKQNRHRHGLHRL